MTSPSPTTSANVKRIVAAFEFARMQRELERRRQRLEKLFTITSLASTTPSPAPLVSLSSPASPTTPPPPTSIASTSINDTTLSSTTTRGPLPVPPARCSTPGHTHDTRTLVLVSAASTPSSTSSHASSAPSAAPTFPLTAAVVLCAKEDIFTTMPTRCSTHCFSHDNMLKSGNTINKCSSLENMQHRYITNSNPASLFDVMSPPMATKVYDAQEVRERKIDQYSVVLWLPFTSCLDLVLSRQPWPPPITFEFRCTTFLRGCSTVSCVFDRGKTSWFRLTTILTTTPTLFHLSADSSWGCLFKYSHDRYMTKSIPAYYIGGVLLCLDIKVYGACKVLGKIISQKVLLEPCHAQVLGKVSWPPTARGRMIQIHMKFDINLLLWNQSPILLLVCMAGIDIAGATMSFSRQVLLYCYPYGVQVVLQGSDSTYEGAFTYMHVAGIKILLPQAGNFVCHHYWLIQIRFSCIGVGGNTNWPAVHMMMHKPLLKNARTWFLNFKYGANLWFSSSVIGKILEANVLEWLTSWECSSNGRVSIAKVFKYRCEQDVLLGHLKLRHCIRLYSEAAIHDGAQNQVTSDLVSLCNACQIKPDIYMGGCTSSKKANIRLRKIEVNCSNEELVRQWTEKRPHMLFAYYYLSWSKLQRLVHSIMLFGCLQRFGMATQVVFWLSTSQWCISEFSMLLLSCGNETVQRAIRIIVFTDNEKIQRKTRVFVWIVAANDILQHIMTSWFSRECCSSGILTSKSLLEKQSVCHFEHEDHNCAFCHWEKHLLADNILTIAENARQLKRGGTLLINICQVQKQLHLHITNFDTLFSASLEHLTASFGNSLESGILSGAIPFCWPIQLPAIYICAYHTSTGPRLSRVAGILIFTLHFYHLMTDDP